MDNEVKKMSAADIEAMYDLVTYAFHSERTPQRRARFEEIAQHSNNYGFFMGGELTSQVMATPFQVKIFGQPYKMAGIGYVASYPEFRGSGGISTIMKTMLQELAKQEVALSYLAPFSYPFYRKYGYEQVFEQAEITIKAAEWPHVKRVDGTIRRVGWEIGKTAVKNIYGQVKKVRHGGLKREDWWFDYALNRNPKDHLAIYQTPEGVDEGYVKYRIEGSRFEIVEWNYLSKQAFQALAGFIGSHNGAVATFHWVIGYGGHDLNYLLPTPSATVKILPYMMARIVNLTTFLRSYPFQAGTSERFYLSITDEYGPWNQGLWQLDISSQGNSSFKKITAETEQLADIDASIQTWTQWLMGYRSGEELDFYGRLSGNKEAIAALAKRINQRQPILEDYF